MNTAFFIAKRYFFSKGLKSKLKDLKFINILTLISMLGVGVVSMLLVVVLSIFNGLEEFTIKLHEIYNPELLFIPKKGKTFIARPSLLDSIRKTEGVMAVTEVIEDNALLRYGDAQMVVKAKGVSANFLEQYHLDSAIVEGSADLRPNGQVRALIGAGVKFQLSIVIPSDFTAMQFWYPKNQQGTNIDPSKSFRKEAILPGGVFSIEQQYDASTVIVPLEFMQNLLEYTDKRSYLEIKCKDEASILKAQSLLLDRYGLDFHIKNALEQQASILRAVKIERLFAFLTCSFILAIASFNIFFSLAMLAIEKRKDVAVLMAFGASPSLIRNIFLFEGSLIAFTGAAGGLLLGLAFCFAQMRFGLISLGVETAAIASYPIKIIASDFLYISLTVVCITLAASFFPARKAANTVVGEHL